MIVSSAVILPNVDTLFTLNAEVTSSLSCFVSNDVLRLTPPLVIVSQVKSLNVKSVVVVNISCFVSKSACVNPPPPPVEEIVFPEIVIFVPASNVFCFLFSWVSTYIIEASLACAFIAACNPDVLAKDKSPSFIKSCFVSKSACVIPPPLEEIVSFIIVILEPAIKIFVLSWVYLLHFYSLL